MSDWDSFLEGLAQQTHDDYVLSLGHLRHDHKEYPAMKAAVLAVLRAKLLPLLEAGDGIPHNVRLHRGNVNAYGAEVLQDLCYDDCLRCAWDTAKEG